MKQSAYDVLYLSLCAIKGDIPCKEKIANMNLDSVFETAQFHHLTAITAYALESAGLSISAFSEEKAKTIRKIILLDEERNKLFSYMENQGIWYLPLKGILLKDYYPKIGMRQMADNDILFDSRYTEEIREWFEQHGYQTVSYGWGNHDVYTKEPVYNYEMHHSLFHLEATSPAVITYFENVKERLIKDDDNKYEFHFTEEDFYIYMISHFFKHCQNGGTGLRTLLDCCVYLTRKKDSLDWHKIHSTLEKFGSDDFERHCRELAEKLYAMPKFLLQPEKRILALTEEEENFLTFCITSGAYGTLEHKIETKINELGNDTGKQSIGQYCKSRLFPDDAVLQVWYPFFYRHKWLLPLCWIYRIFKALTIRRKTVGTEIRYLCSKMRSKIHTFLLLFLP